MPELSRENLEKQLISTKEENLEMKKGILLEEELIEESNLETEKWIEKHGERFREIIKEKPELLNNKERFKQEPYKERSVKGV